MELVTAWRDLDAETPPYVLPGDEAVLKSSLVVTIRSEQELLEHADFDFAGSAAVHLGLLPVPYAGNLGTADIFVLLLNPGFRPSDYFAELRDLDFRRALVANLRQQAPPGGFDVPYFDPRFSYHGGYEYWRKKLRGVLDVLMQQRTCTLLDALRILANRVAFLEMFPYHSSVAGLSPRLFSGLRSTSLIRRYVAENVVPRTRANDALIVATRQAASWGLEEGKNIVVYRSAEARSAHLSPNSRGGRAILERLRLSTHGR